MLYYRRAAAPLANLTGIDMSTRAITTFNLGSVVVCGNYVYSDGDPETYGVGLVDVLLRSTLRRSSDVRRAACKVSRVIEDVDYVPFEGMPRLLECRSSVDFMYEVCISDSGVDLKIADLRDGAVVTQSSVRSFAE